MNFSLSLRFKNNEITMLRISIIFTILVAAVMPSYAQSVEGIEFDVESFDFGGIEELGGEVSHTFSYTNVGKTPFVITDVQTSCGCTTPEYSRKPLLSGKSDSITITFDPRDRGGYNSKQIIIASNLGNIFLEIEADVNPREKTFDEKYPFALGGGLRSGIISMSMATVEFGSYRDIEIELGNSNTSLPISVEVDKSSLPVGVTIVDESFGVLHPRSSRVVRLRISGREYGSFAYPLYFRVNGRVTTTPVTIGGVTVFGESCIDEGSEDVQPRGVVSKRYISLGRVKMGESYITSFEVKNNGNAPLEILGVEVSPSVELEIASRVISSLTSRTIRVRYTPSMSGYDSQPIRILFNDAQLPLCDLHIMAEVE